MSDLRLAHLQGRRLEFLHIWVAYVVLVTYLHNSEALRDSLKDKEVERIPVAGEDSTHFECPIGRMKASE